MTYSICVFNLTDEELKHKDEKLIINLVKMKGDKKVIADFCGVCNIILRHHKSLKLNITRDAP